MNNEINNANNMNPQPNTLNNAYEPNSINPQINNEMVEKTEMSSANIPNDSQSVGETPSTINPIIGEITTNDVISEDEIQLENANVYLNTVEKNDTMISELNVAGTYNNMNTKNYEEDPKVQENIKQFTQKQPIKVSAEAKTFLVIAIIILIFIIAMPYLYDIINKIKYH